MVRRSLGLSLGVVLGVVLASLSLLACNRDPESGRAATRERTIAVIPKGTTHEFWKSVHAGAAKAASELGVKIEWKGPPREDDRDQQIKVVEDFVTKKVAAIVLAPLDDQALVAPCADAAKAGIPVVIIDSGIRWDGLTSFVATDNQRGGELGARRLAEVLGGKGKVLLLRYAEGSASTTLREAGFLATMKEFPGIELVSTDQHGGATPESALQTMENLLTRFADLDGIFTPNESTTFGTLRALIDAGRAGKVKLVGFDASKPLLDGLRQGQIQGLVVQNPFRMGELGVRTAVAALDAKAAENVAGNAAGTAAGEPAGKPAREPIAKRIDTGCFVVTPENVASPAIAEQLHPDLARWLGEK